MAQQMILLNLVYMACLQHDIYIFLGKENWKFGEHSVTCPLKSTNNNNFVIMHMRYVSLFVSALHRAA